MKSLLQLMFVFTGASTESNNILLVTGTSHCRSSEKIATRAIGNEGSSRNPGMKNLIFIILR